MISEELGIYGGTYFYVIALSFSIVSLLMVFYYWKKGILTFKEDPMRMQGGEDD